MFYWKFLQFLHKLCKTHGKDSFFGVFNWQKFLCLNNLLQFAFSTSKGLLCAIEFCQYNMVHIVLCCTAPMTVKAVLPGKAAALTGLISPGDFLLKVR